MRVLVALGGNALVGPDGSSSPGDQVRAVTRAAEPVADLVAAGHEVVLTHGNGPQVGDLLVMNELAAAQVPPVPLDWCVAQTQATVGVVLADAVERALAARGVRRPVATVVTRTLVDAADPAFGAPSKPIGRYLQADQAQLLVQHGETWQDRGARGWRRVVASPEPVEVLDAGAARALVDAGFVVICGGGGGVPCVREDDGSVRGVEAVVDKDLTAALLARSFASQVLVVATDVDHVSVGWGTPSAQPLHEVRVARLRELAAAGEFAAGSMGPKVEAACRFVAGGGRFAVVCALGEVARAVRRRAGTVVLP